MLKKTEEEYRRIADHFCRDLAPVNIDNILSKLERVAYDYRPPYFTRLKCALKFSQAEKGYAKSVKPINDFVNPSTWDEAEKKYKVGKRKKPRCKALTPKQYDALYSNSLVELQAVLSIGSITGARPVEWEDIKFMGDNCIFITGAKKSHKGLRGADRTLKLTYQDYLELKLSFADYREFLFKKPNLKNPKEALRKKLSRLAKKLFPKKPPVTFYTLRHQFGANIKASDISEDEGATMMGHQSTESINPYGDKRTGSGGFKVSAAIISPTVRHPKSDRNSLGLR